MDTLVLNFWRFNHSEMSLKSQLNSEYDSFLVVLSIIIIFIASYTVFQVTLTLTSASRTTHRIKWIVGASSVMGLGIWSMHFIGMLAFSLPIPIHYSIEQTLLSIPPAILGSSVFLILLTKESFKKVEFSISAFCLAIGVGLMHFIGMSAMQVNAIMRYQPVPFILTILLGIVLFHITLYTFFYLNNKKLKSRTSSLGNTIVTNPISLLAPITMAASVSVVHYMEMSATYFYPQKHITSLVENIFTPFQLGVIIAIGSTFLILLLTVAVIINKRFEIINLLTNDYMKKIVGQENRFRSMVNSSPVMIWITDITGTSTFVNQSWLDFTGLDMEGASFHENWMKAIHPDDEKTAFLEYYRKDNKDKSITTEYRLRNAEGEYRWILDQGEPLLDEKGLFNGYIGSAIDITERKQVELDLHIAAIAFESQLPMVITDAASVIIRLNKAFTETTGYTEDDAIGQKTSLLKSGRHDTDFYASMWNELLTKGSWQGEIWDRRKNGEIYPKWLMITAVKQKKGEVTHYIATHTDITARKEAEEKIKHLAFYDSLTQLPNRRLLQERLKYSLEIGRRNDGQMCLMMLDLDRFKAVNDSLGHITGDELLKQVAKRITSQLRDGDTLARLGGDEFVILIEKVRQSKDVEKVAQKIISDLDKPFSLPQSKTVQIGASIGISLYPQHGKTPDELIGHADVALYQAKDAGRGCYVIFSE